MTIRYSSSPTFIFLEFLDNEICSLLNGLIQSFGKSKNKSNIHITVRGPFYHPISEKELTRYAMLLEHEPVLIQSAGMFSNEKEAVVYIKVSHKNLKKIWKKPDYPMEVFGFNPHISIYKGPDKGLARAIYRFLKNENITLLCHDFRLTTFVSKQLDFFPVNSSLNKSGFPKLCRWKKIRSDILERAEILINNYRKAQANKSRQRSPVSR